MNLPTVVEVRNLTDVVKGIVSATGRATPDVIDFEMGKVLEACVRMTPAAQVAKINNRMENREWGVHNVIYTPKRTNRRRTREPVNKYKYSWKYPDAVWRQITEQRKASLEYKLARRGLSKQSWFKLAEELGLEIKVPGYVRKIPLNIQKNFQTERRQTEDSYFLSVVNAQPTINRIGGERIARKAIAGRINYFKTNLAKGVLNEADKVARAYPGLVKVTAPGGELE